MEQGECTHDALKAYVGYMLMSVAYVMRDGEILTVGKSDKKSCMVMCGGRQIGLSSSSGIPFGTGKDARMAWRALIVASGSKSHSSWDNR